MSKGLEKSANGDNLTLIEITATDQDKAGLHCTFKPFKNFINGPYLDLEANYKTSLHVKNIRYVR